MKKTKCEKSSKVSFWKVFWFIIKISLISFGGGNAIFPIIKTEAVNKYKWITEEQLDEIMLITNALPGASVPEAISYLGITLLGKWKGLLVTFCGLLPHIFIFFGLFLLGTEFIPQHYLSIIYVAVMPIIIAMLIMLVIRYIKLAKKELSYPVFFAIFFLTVGFNLFVPSPWNIPAFVIVLVFIIGIILELYRKHHVSIIRDVICPLAIEQLNIHHKQLKRMLRKTKYNKLNLYNFLCDIFPTISFDDLNVKYKAKWNNKNGLYLMACKQYKFIDRANHA